LVGRFHPSKGAAIFALAALLPACNKDPRVIRRMVTAHVPSACAPAGDPYALFYELGDFEPSPPGKGHVLAATAAQSQVDLPEIDPAARTLVVQATENDKQWSSLGDVPATGDVDFLLLPSLSSCPFSTPVWTRGDAGDQPRTQSTLGAIESERVLIVGGRSIGSGAPISPFSYLLRLDTGEILQVTPDLAKPRLLPTVTPFGDRALVAGGYSEDGSPLDQAEVFVPALGGFDQHNPIVLSEPRADHGAVVLTTGQTLLVGGVGGTGGQPLLGSMEIVDPATSTVRAENVAGLAVPRRAPTVLRLASGEILVAGGFDAAGNVVSTLEWFLPDASRSTRTAQLVAASSPRAFAALEGGGALAVIAPPAGITGNFQNVWVIGADGALDAATPITGSLTQPILFGGAGGAPLLWTGDRWLRYRPWAGTFGSANLLDDTTRITGTTATGDPGLALWLDVGALAVDVRALRFDVRNEYSTLLGPLLASDDVDTAPDRLPSSGLASFDPSRGLSLAQGVSTFVTDRTYADVAIDLEAPTGAPPLVVLRDELGVELEVGGPACPGPRAAGPVASVHVQRNGAGVAWSVTGGVSGACGTGVRAAARLSVGVRGPPSGSPSVVRNLRVERLVP
jgi:hypothetical protein